MEILDSDELRKTATLQPASISDHELMFLLRNSRDRQEHENLFDEFYRRFHPRVKSWCFRLSRDRVRAFDLAQEVLLKAWCHLDSFRGESRPSTWLYVITRNHCLSALQRLVSDPLDSVSPLSPRLWDSALPHPDAHIERDQRYQRVCRLMQSTLDPMEARILTLHYAYEVPLGTLTSRMALANPSGAKAYIVNGRRKLKCALKRREPQLVPAASISAESAGAEPLRKSA